MWFEKINTDEVKTLIKRYARYVADELKDMESVDDDVVRDLTYDMIDVTTATEAVMLIVYYGQLFAALTGDIDYEESPQKCFERDVYDEACRLLVYAGVEIL